MLEMLESLATADRDRLAATNLNFGSWSCCSHAPGMISNPSQLDEVASNWLLASVPGTVASTLSAANQWDMQQPPKIDALDWWYRTTFAGPKEVGTNNPCWINFDGLATLAEIWLNGQLRLKTENMFRAYRLDVSPYLRSNNELVLGFRSVAEDLQKKRPRPRWKTNLVNHQQLRWRRTSLLGRIPGWSPPVPAIGPWRDIRLEQASISLTDVQLLTRLDGGAGIVTLQAGLQSTMPVDRVYLLVGDQECEIEFIEDTNCLIPNGESPQCAHDVITETRGVVGNKTGSLTGTMRLPNVPLWWPHTHGAQSLFSCQVIVEAGSDRHQFECGKIGFRSLLIDQTNGFAVLLNGEPVYCRGACWTVSDVFTVDGTEESLRRDLTLARDAGANLLRVIGSMTYESDHFYRLCDELGLMVWQDFMFANMDYPVDDSSFAENIESEAVYQLRRLSSHPSIIVYCGNSEVEQQAAMLGIPRDRWTNSWFGKQLEVLCAEYHPGTAYITSTPTGGVLPFHPNSGISHYYGVGAYLRSPAELRQASVKFTPECLGFANIPEPDIVNEITAGASPAVHHPKWKQRIPRDTGAGWDFEDVRDHYLKHVYGLDPIALRSSDMSRYLELSRLVSGEMMAQTFSEWRSQHSLNRGGLVWFFKDLWPAAGWGVIDSSSLPKAAYYFLKRTWQNRQITVTDEGLNGLHLHIINETAVPLQGFVEVTLLREPNIVVARNEIPLKLAGRGRQLLSADEVLGGFYDVSYAYKFGPPHHDVAVATLFEADRQVIGEAFYFVRRRESNVVPVVVEAIAEMAGYLEYQVTLQSERFLHNVRLSAPGYQPIDNYFHLVPARKKVIRFVANVPNDQLPALFKVDVEALNLETPITVSASRNRD